MRFRAWMQKHVGRPFGKFFRDRGTHLAAMVAYFALLSFVPLIFLALALLGVAGQPDESTYLVKELQRTFPGTPVNRIVDYVGTVQDNAATLGLVGAVFLLWTSLSLFSVLESAFNIVYGRPNRGFFHGKALAVVLLLGSLATLFFGLLFGSLGYRVLEDLAPSFLSNTYVAYTVSVLTSTVAALVFLVASYYFLTNEKLTLREVLPGSLVATVALAATFQAVPLYLRVYDDSPALQVFGGPVILLVWLYLTANVIVFGAEVNYAWRPNGERAAPTARLASRNRDKLRELRKAFPDWWVELLEADDYPAETGRTFAENAVAKARFGRRLAPADEWVLGEDSGIEVVALGDRPGVETARWAEGEHVARMLSALDGVDDRRARYVCELVAIAPDGREVHGRGELAGRIASSARGGEGFGFDPIFVPEGSDRTVAELGNEWKAGNSHRARAATALRARLDAM